MREFPCDFCMFTRVKNESAAAPPWPGGAKSRARVVLVHAATRAEIATAKTTGAARIYYLSEGARPLARAVSNACGVAAELKAAAEFEPRAMAAEFASRDVVVIVSEPEAGQLAARLLNLTIPAAARLDENAFAIVDIDDNGACIKQWNIQIDRARPR